MVNVERTDTCITPENSRVLIRPFLFAEDRMSRVIARVMSLSEKQVTEILDSTVRSYSDRHFDVEDILQRHYERAKQYHITDLAPSRARQLLIGAYFTSEYAFESAALFNPSMVPHPDQAGVPQGAVRFVMSLRAVGEGHLSSIAFREGIIKKDYTIEITEPTQCVIAPDVEHSWIYDKDVAARKIYETGLENDYTRVLLELLPQTFTTKEIQQKMKDLQKREYRLCREYHDTQNFINWFIESNYELRFAADCPMSARVIFPSAPSESNGIEDARFVQFTNEDGRCTYYGTYVAYNGRSILPMMMCTEDFLHFKVHVLNGKAVNNKGMALFPQKIDGKYAMLSRQDGENLYLMYSDDIFFWQEATPLIKPSFPWEYVQIGNCGSPLLTDEGWLVLTHGVGPMREYRIGVILLDKKDPTKVIGRLKESLLRPKDNEREGYVPNVVYTCGAMVHNGSLVLPYAMSDYATSIALIDMKELLSALT